ncbi:hypothetical protein HanRHA438_Chr13g0622371 [Helianthus annuus]|nr:hypothetical protein HanRHA438_Chr13g0622371 [Helianthus annuus]
MMGITHGTWITQKEHHIQIFHPIRVFVHVGFTNNKNFPKNHKNKKNSKK